MRNNIALLCNMPYRRYLSVELDSKSCTSSILICTGDSITPAPQIVLGDTTWCISRLRSHCQLKKKSWIFAVKNHFKITSEADLRGIPVLREYCYLGGTMDEWDRFYCHLEKIQKKKRSNYLRANMLYYSRDLSLENQYLLWSTYLRPYYLYTASVIGTRT